MFSHPLLNFSDKVSISESKPDTCDWLLTHIEKLSDGKYRICAESKSYAYIGLWSVITDSTEIYTSSSPEAFFCFTADSLGEQYLIKFQVGDKLCAKEFDTPPSDFECIDPGFTIIPGTNEIKLDSMFIKDTLGNLHKYTFKLNNSSAAISTYDLVIYSAGDATQICITSYSFYGRVTPVTCCYSLSSINCCHTADFLFEEKEVGGVSVSSSCFNPEYTITPYCTAGFNKWEYEDGKVFYGAYPPTDYIFSNFTNSDGQVCITHTNICEGDTLVTTKCASHPNGYFLGKPNESTRLTDSISWSEHPDTITVKDFITLYSHNPSIPLLIDGELVLDEHSTFIGGNWYMGKLASIFNSGYFFLLSGVKIQGAVRVVSSMCCTWKGIEAVNDSRIVMNNYTEVNDALVMLHYPYKSTLKSLPLWVENCTFRGNIIGLKITDQPVKISKFSGNGFLGQEECLCGCGVVNGFDFRTESGNPLKIDFPKTGARNTIYDYEKGVLAKNVSLGIYNFDILNLENHDAINLDGWDSSWSNQKDDARIGVDYQWDRSGNSYLTIDKIRFADTDTLNPTYIRAAVRERISNGRHTLTADAKNGPGGIEMTEVNNGYDLKLKGFGRLENSLIKNNKIYTTAANNSTGIDIGVETKNNALKILSNEIKVGGGNYQGHGIILNSLDQVIQKFVVEHNDIELSSNSSGNGIHVNNCQQSVVKSNTLEVKSDNAAINLIEGDYSDIICNYIVDSEIGLYLQNSGDSRVMENYFEESEKNNLRVSGDCMGAKGSLIALNDFVESDEQAVLYEEGTTTGPQYHNGYNHWYNQSGEELRHEGGSLLVDKSKFRYPSGAILGSISYPESLPIDMMVDFPLYSLISPVCGESYVPDNPGNELWMDTVAVSQRYAEIISDTSLASSLTAAQYGHLLQNVYALLKKNPLWTTANVVLDNFVSSESSGFTGQSVLISDSLEAVEHSIALQQQCMQPLSDSSAVLTAQAEALNDLLVYATDPDSINTIMAELELIDSLNTLLNTELNTLNAAYQSVNTASLYSIKSLNDAMTVSGDYQTWEKSMTGIKLKLLMNVSLSSADSTLIRSVASACYKDGGRSVYMARNLSNACLKEYYKDDDCDLPEVAPRESTNVQRGAATLWPNPAQDKIYVAWESDKDVQHAEVTIRNASGMPVYSQTYDNNEQGGAFISVDGMAAGLYFVEIRTGDHVTMKKLIIVR